MKNYVKQAIGATDAYELHPSQLLIAGPTSGKTWLQSKHPGILDSDDVWNKWGFFKDWHDMPNSREIPLAWIIRFLSHGNSEAWLTNIWGEDYLNVLLGKQRKGLIMVYRNNPKLVKEIMDKRFGNDTEMKQRYNLKRITGWVDAWNKYADRVTKDVIILKDDQYLADVVELTSGNTWKRKVESKISAPKA